MRKGFAIFNTWRKVQPKAPASSRCELYRTCSQLLMDKFIVCFVDNDLTPLIISGTPTEQELADAWRNIKEEYTELVRSEEQQHSNDLNAEIIVIQNRIFRINMCVEALKYVYTSDLVEELREQHMPFEYNPDFPDQYYTDLQKTIERTNGLHLKLKLKQDELQEWYEQNTKNKTEVSREQFDTVLAALTEANGFLVDESKITVTQYARMINRYHAKLIAQQREIDKRVE